MGFLQSYSSLLIKHPSKILIGGVAFVLCLMGITILLRPLPSFNDPLIGFEARDTYISSRINTWKLLLEETSASANNLSLVTNSPIYEGQHQFYSSRINNELNQPELGNRLPEPPLIEESTQHGDKSPTPSDIYDEDEEDYYRSINATNEHNNDMIHYSLSSSKAFCGKLYEGYAQVVIAPSARNISSGLFNLNSMIAVCQLDKRLRLKHSSEDSAVFQRECERFELETSKEKNKEEAGKITTCCNSWSLPNHVACLGNKTSCMEIDSADMKTIEQLLNLCAPYYFKAPYEECFNEATYNKELYANTGAASLNMLSSHGFNSWPRPHCGWVPDSCLKCNGWIYTVMHYLTNENFITNRVSNDEASNKINNLPRQRNTTSSAEESLLNKLSHTNIFLPVAKSSSLMKYYNTLMKHNLKTPFAQVKAMNLGLKNTLFEHLVFDDSRLFVIALISILLVISIYTWSLVLSMVILMIICLSLCLSYTIYELALNIPIFPFMNLLAVVISFGICSDNAMLFCKHWTLQEEAQVDQRETMVGNSIDKDSNSEKETLDRMLRRSTMSTFVATLATACSFSISAISKVIAVRCFCIFATLSVVTNYLLIVVLLPPALIIDSRFSRILSRYFAEKGPKLAWILSLAQYFRDYLLKLGDIIHKQWIFNLVTRYKFYLIITFITLLSCSSILVFHRPTLQPHDEEDIQLFSSKHTFEQYDKSLRKQFRFERLKAGESIIQNNDLDNFHELPDTLPVRIVFGLVPTDNGDHLDPQDRGSLTFNPKFDIAEPNAQIWLLDFCHKLKQKRFIRPSPAPELSNCFIDTFKSWMETRSCRDPVQTELDRSPCCMDYEFPYSRDVFNKCIGEAVNIIRKTPQFHPNLNAGVRFFKNSTKVAALIVEYQSNRLYTESFTKMERFFNNIDEWVTWQINNTAPASLKSGWFISSNLDLLALQTELEQSTTSSILLEVLFATLAMMIGSRDLILTIAGTLTIGTIIIVTVAVLIVLRWTLGVAESILISLTIGLSIDFALHYSVAYSEIRKKGANSGTIFSILNDVGSPIALATITTSLAGFVIAWSDILAYQELGVFLMLIASVSWFTSTFFLLPMLASVGSFEKHELQMGFICEGQ